MPTEGKIEETGKMESSPPLPPKVLGFLGLRAQVFLREAGAGLPGLG